MYINLISSKTVIYYVHNKYIFLYVLCASTDENDYSPLSGFGGLVSFNNLNRRRCINIRITEDEFYEFEESFQLRLGGLPNIDLPSNLVVDPAVANVTIVDNEGMCVAWAEDWIDHDINLFNYIGIKGHP